MSGDWDIGWQIICNILFFIPLGILLRLLTDKKRYLVILILLSCTIEILQLVTMRGLFEFDDIINNAAGAVLGWLLARRMPNKWVPLFGIAGTVALTIVCVALSPFDEVLNIPRMFCFQFEGKTGFVFRPGKSTPEKYQIVLKNTKSGEIEHINAITGIERSDVAGYFGEEYRYSGFELDGSLKGEYEIIVEYNSLLSISTQVLIGSSGIHCISDDHYIPPNITSDFVRLGTVLVYRSDYHCWVYQYEGSLYWIVDQDFYFEDDGTTYIQYQLWTTKQDHLPKKRLKYGWDNIGGCFEEYELKGDFGEYRVMKRDLPTAYPIISIETGYYKNGEWIWKEYFRPLYQFMIE